MSISSVTASVTEAIQLVKALATLVSTVREMLGLQPGESVVDAVNKLTDEAAAAAAAVATVQK